jgi:predicted nucleic acid-binding protein
MARLTHLADTSVFARLTKPNVRATFAPLAAAGRVALCAPVAFELGVTVRSGEHVAAFNERLNAYALLPTHDGDHQRALAVQQLLMARGQHRGVSLVDALVAAIAESRQLIVLHYDTDFELVAAVTSQRQQWIVPPGTAD